MFIKYCHREGLTEISADKIEIRSFDRDKLQRNFGRDTFTEEVWETLYTTMKSYCAKKIVKTRKNITIDKYQEITHSHLLIRE